MQGSYLGTEFNQREIEEQLKPAGAEFEVLEYEELINKTAELLSEGKVGVSLWGPLRPHYGWQWLK